MSNATKSSVCGVQIATWGTHKNGGNGMPHYLNTKLFGGNVGHATVRITFPADEHGKKLLKKYCSNPPIPYEKHRISTPEVKNVDGKWVETGVAFEEEVFVVNFSWWPSSYFYALATSINDDSKDEREGVHVEMAPKWKEILQPEERYHAGKLGRTKMTYGVSGIVHNRGLSSQQAETLDVGVKYQMLEQELESLNVLKDKINNKNESIKSIKERKEKLKDKNQLLKEYSAQIASLNKLLKLVKAGRYSEEKFSDKEKGYLDKAYPKWKEDLKKTKKLDLQNEIKTKVQNINKKIQSLQNENPKALTADEHKATKFSDTEILLLNRFYPKWREEYKEPLTEENIKELHKKINEKKAEIENEREKTEKKLLELTSPSEKIKSHLEDIKKYKKMEKLEKQLAQLIDPNSSEFIGDKSLHITHHHKKILKTFSELTGIDWKDLVHARKRLNKNDIKLLQEKLYKSKEETKKNIDEKEKDPECKHALARERFEKIKIQILDWKLVYEELKYLTDKRGRNYLAPGKTADITGELERNLNDAFGHIKREWREEYVKEKEGKYQKITREEADKLLKLIEREMKKAQHKLIDIDPGLDIFKQNEFENFLSLGLPPDDIIHLQLDRQSAANGIEYGMNVESMLKAMQHISRTEKFSLDTSNCSTTVSRILEAGATTPYLKSKFRNQALGAIANPQMVVNNALAYQSAQSSPQDNWLKKLARWAPIERLGGWCFKKLLVEKNVPVFTKVAAIALGIPIGAYALIKTGITKLANPLKSFNDLRNFANYANSHSHRGFKVLAAIGYVLGFAITAPFAAIQYITQQIQNGISVAVQRLFGKKNKAVPSVHVDLSKEETAQRALHEQSTKALFKDLKIIEISAKTAKEAFEQFDKEYAALFQAILQNPTAKTHTIVVFTPETIKDIESEIKSTTIMEKRTQLEKEYKKILGFIDDQLTVIQSHDKRAFDEAQRKEAEQKLEKTLPLMETMPWEMSQDLIKTESLSAQNHPKMVVFSENSTPQETLDEFAKDKKRQEKHHQAAIKRQRQRASLLAQFTDEANKPPTEKTATITKAENTESHTQAKKIDKPKGG